MKRTSRYLVPLVLGTIAAGALWFAGCNREEEVKKPLPSKADPPSVYMKDPEFRAALDKKRVARMEVLGAREKLLQELEQRVDAMREKMPGADDAAVKEALEQDPEWNSLVKRIADTNAAFDDNRKATTKIVAKRLAARKQQPLK